MTGRMQDKVCVVTGGARGLGLAAAERLLAEGARVLLTDIDASAGRAQQARLEAQGLPVRFVQHDVTDAAQWRTALDAATDPWGRIDVLVNNAGIGAFESIDTASFESWRRTLSVNLDGVFLGIQQVLPRMKASKGGSIVNIASIEGIVGEALLPAYNASKAAVRLLSKSTAIHCARSGYGVRVNSVCPGFVGTELVSNALAQLSEADAQALAAVTIGRIPMGRFGEPAEIANVVLFLASDESSYVTGADLVVDGGLTA